MKKHEFNHAAGDFLPRLDSDSEKEVLRYSPTALMLKNRIILVAGGVDTNLMVNVVAQLKYLERLNPTEEITLLINSPGGNIIDGLAIYDIMREVGCPIRAIGNGMQASMGSVILAGGDKREMTKSSQLMIHQGSTRAQGQPTDVAIGADLMARVGDRCNQIYEDHIGLTREYWGLVLNRDTWFTAEQALAIGFIDRIVEESAVTPEKPGPRYKSARSDVTDFMRAKREKIKGMTAEEIIRVINSDGADAGDGDWARIRPEMAVALAQFPRFWTEGKKAEMAAKASATNDNDVVTAPTAVKIKAPTP